MRGKGDDITRDDTKVASQFGSGCAQINVASWFYEAEQSKITKTWNNPVSNRNPNAGPPPTHRKSSNHSNVTLSHVQSKYQNNTPPTRKLHRSAYLLCSIPLYSVHIKTINPAFLHENPGYEENPRRQQVKTPSKTRKSSLFTQQGLKYLIFILFIYLFTYL